MKSIVFDTGPIISLTTNNLLWLLEPLKVQFNGSFFITPYVKYELCEKPLATKKYKFEALQVLQIIEDDILQIVENKTISEMSTILYNLANNIFQANNHSISIVHTGEMEGLALAHHLNSEAFIIDERTTRMLIEEPKKLAFILRHKLHTAISVNQKNLKTFLNYTQNIRLLRSMEIVVIAYELKLLDKYLVNIPSSRKTLLDGLLWGIKLNGCAISEREINEAIKLENKGY